MPRFAASGLAALLLAAALGCARAAAVTTVEYEGQNMTFTSLNGTRASFYDSVAVEQTPWWGNATAAEALCNLVGSTLGVFFDNGGYGAAWIIGKKGGDPAHLSGYWFDTPCAYFSEDVSLDPMVIALQVQDPSSTPPNCSQAAFSPPALSSRLNSQVCAANKDARQGKTPKLSTLVALSLPPGPDNETATINITDIVMNSATASWKCPCRPTKRDNCTCNPNAALLGGGSFRVMPQWRRFTLPGAKVDTTFQVSFTATNAAGSCSGTAVLCSSWGVRPNNPPPVCTPFNSTGVTRPALTCI